MTMELIRLSHICLNTGDLHRAVDFYCNILGCKVIHEYKNDSGEVYGHFLLINNNTFLEFFQGEPVETASSPFRHICFEVDNINEWAEHLAIKGYIANMKRGRTDRVLQFWIKDPDGNMIEFHQYDQSCIQYEFLS